MKKVLAILVVGSLSACGVQSTPTVSATSDHVAVETLSCMNGERTVFTLADDVMKLLDEDLRWAEGDDEENGALMYGEVFAIDMDSDGKVIVEGEIPLHNFDLETTVEIDTDKRHVNFHFIDTDDRSEYRDFFWCSGLVVNGEKFAYPTDGVKIPVDDTLRRAELVDMVYHAARRAGYYEDEGMERSIRKSRMEFQRHEIVKASGNSHGIVGMQVRAFGSDYSEFEDTVMDWDCNVVLYKALGRWHVDEAECEVEPEGDPWD